MLTIITPTYNRAHTLPRCYKSLIAQSNKNFLWLIVDDGSTDGTKDLVECWICEKKISIKYINKTNGGKASALNLGYDHVKTPFLVCLDSDDTFAPGAVERALLLLESIHDDECCGIFALRSNPDGSVIGGKQIPEYVTKITPADERHKYKLNGEGVFFSKSDVITQYRFPSFSGEKFVSPGWIEYKVCETHYYKPSWGKFCYGEYMEDGLTKNKRKVIVNNPNGYTCIKQISLKNATVLSAIIRIAITYNCGCILSKEKDWLKNSPRKFWTLITRPLGWVMYYLRFYKLKKHIER